MPVAEMQALQGGVGELSGSGNSSAAPSVHERGPVSPRSDEDNDCDASASVAAAAAAAAVVESEESGLGLRRRLDAALRETQVYATIQSVVTHYLADKVSLI
jgi:hypothetical protein